MYVKEKLSFSYKAVKAYFRLMINGFYYRHYYCEGVENIPEEGTPVIMVSNHQNAMNDAMGVLLGVNDRKMRFIVRADAFDIHPWFTKFILWAGLLPAYRLFYQSGEDLGKNMETFRLTENDLRNGHSILIYPEAGHQSRHWLGFYTQGYLRIAFETAEKENFQRDILILPSCNHYNEFHGLRNDMLIRFGKPISLQPYYEAYKKKPRTTRLQVNELVRQKIRELMLDVQDLEHYDDIDYLRNSAFGQDFARSIEKNPDYLPDKLDADRELVARLAANEIPYDEVRGLRTEMESLGLEDRQFEKKPTLATVLGEFLLLLVTLPLAVFAIWPSVLCWAIPNHFSRRMHDENDMFQGTFVLAINVLLILPITFLLTAILEWPLIGPWALLHAFALAPLCVFEWYWCKLWRRMRSDIRFLKARKRTPELQKMRRNLFDALKVIVNRRTN